MADDFAMRLIAAEENQRQSVEASDGDRAIEAVRVFQLYP